MAKVAVNTAAQAVALTRDDRLRHTTQRVVGNERFDDEADANDDLPCLTHTRFTSFI